MYIARSAALFAGLIGICFAASDGPAGPRYTPDGKLILPQDYREWVFLSSGLGMTYGPAAEHATDDHPLFDNVFVSPAAHRAFRETGRWPDQTMFVLEVRSSQSKGSINNAGRFQSDLVAVEAEVKDEKRFAGKWMFYGFGKSGNETKPIPVTASCYSCHAKNGAVDNTFVQFYPTLIHAAKEKGTWRGE
jgi:hypothetical protein